MSPERTPQAGQGLGPKLAGIVIVIVIAVTVSEIAVGFGQGAPPAWEPVQRERPEMAASVFPVGSYLDLNGKARSPNRDWVHHLDQLVSDVELDESALPVDPELRQQVVDRYAARRDYPGARAKMPTPLVPHPIAGQADMACMQCHGETGKVIGTLVAPPMRHKFFNNCGKCHKTEDEVRSGQ